MGRGHRRCSSKQTYPWKTCYNCCFETCSLCRVKFSPSHCYGITQPLMTPGNHNRLATFLKSSQRKQKNRSSLHCLTKSTDRMRRPGRSINTFADLLQRQESHISACLPTDLAIVCILSRCTGSIEVSPASATFACLLVPLSSSSFLVTVECLLGASANMEPMNEGRCLSVLICNTINAG